MLIKSLFKSSFSQSNVVLRGRFVICSGDLCVVDNSGRQATVVERALFFRSAVSKASLLSWLLLLDSTFLLCLFMIDPVFSIQL